MSEGPNLDAYSPQQIAERVDSLGVAKARLPLLSMVMLGMLAGAFIGLGALYYTLVISDASLSFAASRVLGVVCFSLGLLLVVVAGAELFTGNNLLAMAWADGKVSTAEVLRNWTVVCLANFAGPAGLPVGARRPQWRRGGPGLPENRRRQEHDAGDRTVFPRRAV